VKNRYALLLSLLAIALIYRAVSGDIVRLKDGRSHEGEIVEETDETIKIKLDMVRGSGYVTVPRDEIRRIVRQTPEDREKQHAEMMQAAGYVKDGDEWVTAEEKAARDAQKQTEQAQKVKDRAPYQQQIEKLRQEQRGRQEKEQAFKDSLNRSGEESTATLRDITLKLIFFAILGIIAFTLLKRYFWD
jgi:hypothetical protein